MKAVAAVATTQTTARKTAKPIVRLCGFGSAALDNAVPGNDWPSLAKLSGRCGIISSVGKRFQLR
jgi:hypothetical protein